MFERLRARLEKLLADHTPSGDPKAKAAQLHAALLDAKVGVGAMRDALAATERGLREERRQLEDAERRGRLAADVPDPETVQVAEQFASRHRERVAMLEKKHALQQEELTLAERDLELLAREYRTARQGAGGARSAAQDAAWDDIEAAGGVRPETDIAGDLLRSQLERRQMEAAVEAQLDHLKKKLKKEE